jgi:hypothetical protein
MAVGQPDLRHIYNFSTAKNKKPSQKTPKSCKHFQATMAKESARRIQALLNFEDVLKRAKLELKVHK